MAKGSPKTTTVRYRDAKDGKFTSEGYGKANPKTTVRERIPLAGYGITNRKHDLQPPRPFPPKKPKSKGKE